MPNPEVFDFPFHNPEVEYPESGVTVQFGNNYTYNAAPEAPDVRKFVLNFKTMFYYIDDQGNIDKQKNPQYNMAVLEDFYQRHKRYKTFLYPHPVYGEIPVRFSKPLQIPKRRESGYGALESFQVELIEKKD